MKIRLLSILFALMLSLTAFGQNRGNGDVFSVGEVLSIFRLQPKSTVTFVGYSGQGYENQQEMLARAETILKKLDPRKWVVNIGVTPDGIGAIYSQVAKRLGFETAGIASVLAKPYLNSITGVDRYYLIADESWGGRTKNGELSPTSEAMVSVTDLLVSIGGGDVGKDETLEAIKRKKVVLTYDAEANHQKAIAKAQKNQQAPPASFYGTNNFIVKPIRSYFLDYSEKFEVTFSVDQKDNRLTIDLVSHLSPIEQNRNGLNNLMGFQFSVRVNGQAVDSNELNSGNRLRRFESVATPTSKGTVLIEFFLAGERVNFFEFESGSSNVLQRNEGSKLSVFHLRQLARRGSAYLPKIKHFLRLNPFIYYEKALTPVVDLHTHFGGALKADSIIRVAIANKLTYPAALLEELNIRYNTNAVVEIRGQKFVPLSEEVLGQNGLTILKAALEIPITGVINFQSMELIYKYRGPIVKSLSSFGDFLWELAQDYKRTGVDYAELSLSDILKPEWLAVAHKVLPDIEARTGVKIRFLAGLWRHSHPTFNNDMINKIIALERSPYIVGADFMGHETNSTRAFENEIKRLAQYRADKNPAFAIRVHAGENPLHPENVKVAIEAGATRIGHGLYGIDDQVLELGKKKNVIFEFQAVSNLSLNNVHAETEIPVSSYSKRGARVTFGTDGGGLYSSTAQSEFAVAKSLGLNAAELHAIRGSDVSYSSEMETTFKFKLQSPDSLVIPTTMPQDVFTDAFWADESRKKQERKESIIRNLEERGIRQVSPTQLQTEFAGKTPILFSGASKSSWPLIAEADQKEIAQAIRESLDLLDPNKTFIVTGGTEYGVEEIVHREARLRGFSIYGTFVTEAQVSSLAEERANKQKLGKDWKPEIGRLTHFGFYGDQWYDKSARVLDFVKKLNGTVVFMGGGNILSDEIQAAENIKMNYLLMKGPAGAADKFSNIYTSHAFVGAKGLVDRLQLTISKLTRPQGASVSRPCSRLF